MVLLGDEAQVDARFSSFGDSANLDARWVHSLRRTYDTLGNHCWTHPMDLLGELVMWNLISVHLETMLGLVQNRCTVCVKRTIAHKLFWTHPMDLLGDIGHVESRFKSFGDSGSVSAR
jgi:hypothetical protein